MKKILALALALSMLLSLTVSVAAAEERELLFSTWWEIYYDSHHEDITENLSDPATQTNTEKDDPKTMNIVVEKGTYNPKSLSAKLKGVTLTMRDLTFGIPEKRVTFNPADYPTAKIVDKR